MHVITRRSAQTKLALGLAGAAAALSFAAPVAQAQSTLPCQGEDIIGRGASFQKNAQANWTTLFTTQCGTAALGAPSITYQAQGSGAGRASVGEGATDRDLTVRFGATDEAPDATQRGQIEAADTVSGAGRLHVIPAAVGAIPVIVNAPDGCTIQAPTPIDGRFQLSRKDLEGVFAGEITTWGQLLGNKISGTHNGAPCSGVAVKRVVRKDSSGTTFIFKDYLNQLDTADGGNNTAWTEGEGQPVNTAWPNEATNPVLRGDANGNGPLSQKVAVTEGSFGYADLATARANGFGQTVGAADTTYWIPAPDVSGEQREPTLDPNGAKTGVPGANCTPSAFSNVPGGSSPTFGDWSKVTTSSSAVGYPVCALTYILAFDDNADVYGNTAGEDAKARTLKDYLTTIVSPQGQGTLQAVDYSALPPTIYATSVQAVAAVGFNK